MKALIRLRGAAIMALFIGAGFIFSACPYESAHALTGEKINIDKRLFGSFQSVDGVLHIEKTSPKSFSYRYADIAVPEPEDTGQGYIVRHDNTLYAVVTGVDNAYLIYKIIEVQQYSFTITELSDELMPLEESFSSAEEFSDFVFSSDDIFNPSPTIFNRK